jgi:hypothetical protein
MIIDKEKIKIAYDYLDSIGEEIFFTEGWDGVNKLNEVKAMLSEALHEPKPCVCIDFEKCQLNDRCCKGD